MSIVSGVTTTEMREPTFLILTALARGPLHGYAVLQEVISLSEGRVRLRSGSLYGTLDRLLEEGLIESVGEEVVEGRRRQYYVLSEDGAASLSQTAERLVVQASEARVRLSARLSGPGAMAMS